MNAPRRLSGILLALLIVIGLATPARAQFAMGAGGDPTAFSAPINRRALEDYARILSLTPEQKEGVKMLYDSYTTSHAELMKEMKKVFEAAQEKFGDTQDMKVFTKELPVQMKDLGARVEKLEKGFYEDCKALLSADQQSNWPRVERHRRRENGMRFAVISGQTVDLVKVIDALKIDPATVPGLPDQLERYEQDMDRALAAAEKFGKDAQNQNMDDFDFSKMQEMMAKAKEMMKGMLEHAKAVRDVNRQYARGIEPLLPEADRPRFEAELNRRAHPRIYREAWIVKAMGAAAGFSDLGEDQKKTVTDMRSDYKRDAESLNKKWAVATEEREEKTGGQFVEMMDMMGGGGGNEDVKAAANKARQDRKELDKRYKEKLLALLSEAQKDRLPEEQKERNGMFGPGGDDFMVTPDDEPPGKE